MAVVAHNRVKRGCALSQSQAELRDVASTTDVAVTPSRGHRRLHWRVTGVAQEGDFSEACFGSSTVLRCLLEY